MIREGTTSGLGTDGITGQVLMALRKIIRAIERHSHVLVTRYGLTGPQLAVLKVLAGLPGTSVSDLAEAVHLSQATVTGILQRLAERGLIARRRDERDRRRLQVWLTKEGEGLLARTPPLLQQHFTERFSRLRDWEQTQILSSLQRLVSMMEARDLDATAMLATGPIDATPEETRAYWERSRQEPAGAEAASQGPSEPGPMPADSQPASGGDGQRG